MLKFIFTALIIITLYGNVQGNDCTKHIYGYDNATAKTQNVISEKDSLDIQALVDEWKTNPDLILVLKGYADGNTYLKDNDAMNPAIALGRCAVAFKLVQSMGADELSRIRCFIEEFSEKGEKHRGFDVSLEPSTWVNLIYLDEINTRILKLTTFADSRYAALLDKINNTTIYIIKVGGGFTFYPDYAFVPFLHSSIGSNTSKWSVELDVAHSIFNRKALMEEPFTVDPEVKEYNTFSRFAAACLSYQLLHNAPFKNMTLSLKAGWHWAEQSTDNYKGYYKRHDGPNFGIGFNLPFKNNLEFNGDMYWIPAEETIYPEPIRGWNSDRVRFSLYITKTL